MAGVFVTKGMTFAVPAGGLTISLDVPTGGTMSIEVHFDVGPTWLEIALHHLEDAKLKQALRVEAWKGQDDEAKAAALEREFEASMQAIMAAAIAIDAFYAVVQTKIKLPPDLVRTWRMKKTARYAQVSEVFRRAFSVRANEARVLRQNLQAIYKLRDQAVHPTGKTKTPVLHPELEVGVEWRFVAFCFANADRAVRETVNSLCQLITNGKPQNSAMQAYADGFRPKLQALSLNTLTPTPNGTLTP
jgi:hypothetical protein